MFQTQIIFNILHYFYNKSKEIVKVTKNFLKIINMVSGY